jgi:hypothetical protein
MQVNNIRFDGRNTRHFSPQSEKFVGGDVLTSMLSNGWKITKEVARVEHYFSDSRHINVIELQLAQNNKLVQISVIVNPFVEQLVG